jgi:O-antigen/teichoic acid export membrane protein
MQSRSDILVKNSLFLYFRTFIQLLLALYTSRIVLLNLGIRDFGIYNIIGGTVSMFAFVNSSLAAATQRFLIYELGKKDYDKLGIIFSVSKKIHQILAIFLFVIVELVGVWFLYNKMNIPYDRINVGFWVLQTSVFVLTVNILLVPYNASIVAHEAFTMFAYIGILDVVLKLLLAIIISCIHMDKLIVYAIGMSCITLLVFIIYRQYCLLRYEECKREAKYDKNVFKEMILFAQWTFLGAFSQICKNQGVNVLLNIFGGVAINAAQGITNQVNSAVTQFVSSFTTALDPQIVKSYSSKDEKYFHKLIYTGSKLSFILMSIISIPVIVDIDYILHLWLKEAPPYTNSFVRLIIVSSLIISWTGPVSMAIRATGKIKTYSLILSVINICILPVSYLFLKTGYMPKIVYTVYVFAQLLTTLIVLLLSKQLLHLHFLYFVKKVIIPVSIIVVISTTILLKIQSFFSESFFRLVNIVIISTVLFVIQCYFFVFSKKEKEMIKLIFFNIRNKFFSPQN